MSEDVAAVIETGIVRGTGDAEWDGTPCHVLNDSDALAADALAALTAAGARVLYVPEGVEVAHGARLVFVSRVVGWGPVYAIEDTPVPECSHMFNEEGTYCLRCGEQAGP